MHCVLCKTVLAERAHPFHWFNVCCLKMATAVGSARFLILLVIAIFFNMTDFSIEYILNRAGEKYVGTNASVGLKQRIKLQPYHPYASSSGAAVAEVDVDADGEVVAGPAPQALEQFPMFDWLQYTRYHPPKLPRSWRQAPVRRTPGRLPRIPFTPAQLDILETAYRSSNYLSAEEANRLAESLELTNTRVKIWFQNRRARERREKREKDESYESTMSSNASSPEPDSVVLTKQTIKDEQIQWNV